MSVLEVIPKEFFLAATLLCRRTYQRLGQAPVRFTLAYDAGPHRSTHIAPLEWVMELELGNLTLPTDRCSETMQFTDFGISDRKPP